MSFLHRFHAPSSFPQLFAHCRQRGGIVAPVQVIFAVSDLRRSLEFYERAFGWPRNDWIDYTNYVELLPPDGGALGLYEREGFAATVGAEPAALDGRVSPAYLYVRVEDVRAAVAALEEAGARQLSPLTKRDWGEEAAWFADPDGNVVAVAQAQVSG
jgi:catechol 2,3-dioxygenase-like lactoylglutathione lyase family enzyme